MRHVPSVGGGENVEVRFIEGGGMFGGLIRNCTGIVRGTTEAFVDVVEKGEEGDGYIDVHLLDGTAMGESWC